MKITIFDRLYVVIRTFYLILRYGIIKAMEIAKEDLIKAEKE